MPAFSFQARFAPLVESGEKTQTIRPHRTHRPRVGQTAYLYQGLRSKHCRKLGEGMIVNVMPIVITCDYAEEHYELFSKVTRTSPFERNYFAREDGFANWQDLVGWFEQYHGLPFTGILVRWEVKS